MAVGVRQRGAPKVVGGHAKQRAGAQHVGVHGHGRYVVVHEITAKAVPITDGHGHGDGHVNGDSDFGPTVFRSAAPADAAAAAAAATVMVLVVLKRVVVVVIVIMR